MKYRNLIGCITGLGVGLATPVLAQDMAADADSDGDSYVTREEARTHAEQRFEELAEGGGELSMEQFHAGMRDPDVVAAEADTGGSGEAAWDRADADNSDSVSQKEWMDWRMMRFDEAAGQEGRVETGLYQSLYSGGMEEVDSGGDVADEAGADSEPDTSMGPDAGSNSDGPGDVPGTQTDTDAGTGVSSGSGGTDGAGMTTDGASDPEADADTSTDGEGSSDVGTGSGQN